MPKIDNFSIILDSKRQVFYPGEHINGHLLLQLPGPLELRGLQISLDGKAYCRWVEIHVIMIVSRAFFVPIVIPVPRSAKQQLFQQQALLFGNPSTASRRSRKSTTNLEAQTHKFPFSFTLPVALPSSVEEPQGFVRYTLTCRIDIPRQSDHYVRKMITVHQVIDPNFSPLANPVGGENTKNVCCCCCKSPPVSATLRLDRAAYCPGETMTARIECNNGSSRRVKIMRLKLVKVVMCQTRFKRKRFESTVVCVNGPGVLPGESGDWIDQKVLIPVLAPTATACDVFKLSYEIRLEVVIARAIALVIRLPVVIATIPKWDSFMGDWTKDPPAPGVLRRDVLPMPVDLLGYADVQAPLYATTTNQTLKFKEHKKPSKLHNDEPFKPLYTYAISR